VAVPELGVLGGEDGLKPLGLEGIEAIVLRTVNDQPTLWDAILPSELLVLPIELGRVDALLDDAAFFAPFAAYFDVRIGRPSIPMETYLRLMFLKFRYRLGFESLCREVADSISWQRFCRIPLGTRVPHPTTLMKISSRCGDDAIAGLNEALLVKAAAGKLLRTDKVRAHTTGSEGRINHLKPSYGWNRTELTGINGARTWYGHGVFAHNLVKISTLAA
jgi:IS5 family transposase